MGRLFFCPLHCDFSGLCESVFFIFWAFFGRFGVKKREKRAKIVKKGLKTGKKRGKMPREVEKTDGDGSGEGVPFHDGAVEGVGG